MPQNVIIWAILFAMIGQALWNTEEQHKCCDISNIYIIQHWAYGYLSKTEYKIATPLIKQGQLIRSLCHNYECIAEAYFF